MRPLRLRAFGDDDATLLPEVPSIVISCRAKTNSTILQQGAIREANGDINQRLGGKSRYGGAAHMLDPLHHVVEQVSEYGFLALVFDWPSVVIAPHRQRSAAKADWSRQ